MVKGLKLYLVSQEENSDYDSYDSFVAACHSVKEARHTCPSSGSEWNQKLRSWVYKQYPPDTRSYKTDAGWTSRLSKIRVKYLGKAATSIKAGVICSSFNAG